MQSKIYRSYRDIQAVDRALADRPAPGDVEGSSRS
jgi:hypothetical protein